MSHSSGALVFAVTLAAVTAVACSKPRGPESPAPEGAVAADAGAGLAAPGAVAVGDVTAGDGAAGDGAPSAVIETLFVRGALAECEAEGRRQCLAVRSAESEPWRNLYAPIEGFSHDPAFDQELRVAVTPLAGAPADAPSVRYRLVEVVSRRPAAP